MLSAHAPCQLHGLDIRLSRCPPGRGVDPVRTQPLAKSALALWPSFLQRKVVIVPAFTVHDPGPREACQSSRIAPERSVAHVQLLVHVHGAELLHVHRCCLVCVAERCLHCLALPLSSPCPLFWCVHLAPPLPVACSCSLPSSYLCHTFFCHQCQCCSRPLNLTLPFMALRAGHGAAAAHHSRGHGGAAEDDHMDTAAVGRS